MEVANVMIKKWRKNNKRYIHIYIYMKLLEGREIKKRERFEPSEMPNDANQRVLANKVVIKERQKEYFLR